MNAPLVTFGERQTMEEQIVIDGVACTTLRRFSDRRALVDFQGAIVMVDKNPLGDVWELSGQPAHGEELDALLAALASQNDKTIVTVTKE